MSQWSVKKCEEVAAELSRELTINKISHSLLIESKNGIINHGTPILKEYHKKKFECNCRGFCKCGHGDDRLLSSVFEIDQNALIDQSELHAGHKVNLPASVVQVGGPDWKNNIPKNYLHKLFSELGFGNKNSTLNFGHLPIPEWFPPATESKIEWKNYSGANFGSKEFKTFLVKNILLKYNYDPETHYEGFKSEETLHVYVNPAKTKDVQVNPSVEVQTKPTDNVEVQANHIVEDEVQAYHSVEEEVEANHTTNVEVQVNPTVGDEVEANAIDNLEVPTNHTDKIEVYTTPTDEQGEQTKPTDTERVQANTREEEEGSANPTVEEENITEVANVKDFSSHENYETVISMSNKFGLDYYEQIPEIFYDDRLLSSVFEIDQDALIDQSDEYVDNSLLGVGEGWIVEKTSVPVSLMGRRDLMTYVTNQIMAEYKKAGGNLNKIQPGHSQFSMTWWPHHIIPWVNITKSFGRTTQKEIEQLSGNQNMTITQLLKIAANQFLQSKGLSPENYYRELDRKTGEWTDKAMSRKKRARGIHTGITHYTKINDSDDEEIFDANNSFNNDETDDHNEMNDQIFEEIQNNKEAAMETENTNFDKVVELDADSSIEMDQTKQEDEQRYRDDLLIPTSPCHLPSSPPSPLSPRSQVYCY